MANNNETRTQFTEYQTSFHSNENFLKYGVVFGVLVIFGVGVGAGKFGGSGSGPRILKIRGRGRGPESFFTSGPRIRGPGRTLVLTIFASLHKNSYHFFVIMALIILCPV